MVFPQLVMEAGAFNSLHMVKHAHWEESDVQQRGKGPSVWAWPGVSRPWWRACWKRTLSDLIQMSHALGMMDTISFFNGQSWPRWGWGGRIGVGKVVGKRDPRVKFRRPGLLAVLDSHLQWRLLSTVCFYHLSRVSSRTISHFTGETFFMRIFIYLLYEWT